MPTVSIIMGAYNCETTLREAVDSVLNQTFTDWEFIICDDASSDSTLKILCEYREKYSDKFIILHNDKNLMLAGSLNRCLEYASGKYVARMDADDISVNDRLKKQVDFLEKNQEYDLVGTAMRSFDESGLNNIIFSKENPTKYDLPKSAPFCHATIMMKKEVYDNLGGYTVSDRTRRMEDVDLWFRFFESGYKGTSLQEPLYLVREDADAFRRRKLKYCFDAAWVVKNGIKLLNLPKKYNVYVMKPIVSYFTPRKLKLIYRKLKR